MYDKEIKNIIGSHNNNGTCQSQTFITNDNYILLEGYTTLKNREVKNFERGWYDLNLNFIRELTEAEKYELQFVLPF